MNWVLIQQVILTILAIIVLIVGVIGLIKVVPEINRICDDAKKAADDSRD